MNDYIETAEEVNEMTFETDFFDAAGFVYDEQEPDEAPDVQPEASGPKVLVLDRKGALTSQLARAAEGLDEAPEVLRLGRPTRIIDVVAETEPDVLIAAPDELTHAGLRRLAQVHRAHPNLVILFSPNGKPVSVSEAAACGVSDVLPYPSTRARMRTKLRRAIETAAERKTERIVFEPAPAPAGPAPVVPVADAHVITVTSATGGCGKTFYATNLAAYIAKATGKRVVLVDFDLQFGEVAVSLRIRPERTVAELMDEPDIAASLADHIVTHESGYDVLCAPKDPISAEKVGPREASAVLEVVRTRYDYVVVDTPPAMNEVVLAAFDQSHSLAVMATMDVPSLKNLRVFLQTLERLKIPATDVSLVLNKAERGTGIDLPAVERLYPQGFQAVLPYAREVTWSLNVGQPVICCDPGAEISRKFFAGAQALVPPADGVELPWNGPAPRRSWFARLLRKGA